MITLVSKCSECIHQNVCKNKELYLKGAKSLEDKIIPSVDDPTKFWTLIDCPIMNINIVCPNYHVDTRIRSSESEYASAKSIRGGI